jgi:hypothetical protein
MFLEAIISSSPPYPHISFDKTINRHSFSLFLGLVSIYSRGSCAASSLQIAGSFPAVPILAARDSRP